MIHLEIGDPAIPFDSATSVEYVKNETLNESQTSAFLIGTIVVIGIVGYFMIQSSRFTESPENSNLNLTR